MIHANVFKIIIGSWMFSNYSLEFASPTMLSMCRSSLNLSKTVPLAASRPSCCPPFLTIPQHSITSGCIWLVLERHGLPNVVQVKVWPWSKPADKNSPKWFTFPPKPTPLGMLSELKFTAHCRYKDFAAYHEHCNANVEQQIYIYIYRFPPQNDVVCSLLLIIKLSTNLNQLSKWIGCKVYLSS